MKFINLTRFIKLLVLLYLVTKFLGFITIIIINTHNIESVCYFRLSYKIFDIEERQKDSIVQWSKEKAEKKRRSKLSELFD